MKKMGIKFNYLTLKEQLQLYLSNKKRYMEYARKSIYSFIRKMIAREESLTSKILNEMLREEVNGEDNENEKEEIYNNKIFKMEEETITVLATSKNWINREKAAMISKDSRFLNKMLRNEAEGYNNSFVKEAIYNNEFFEIEEETIKVLAASSNWRNRANIAELLQDSEFLNQMFRNEVQSYDNEFVKYEIYSNESFKIEEQTIKVLEASSNVVNHQIAVKLSKDKKIEDNY